MENEERLRSLFGLKPEPVQVKAEKTKGAPEEISVREEEPK